MELSTEELVDWPPFYTYLSHSLQPNLDIREQQLTHWIQLIANYCRNKRLFSITAEDLTPITRNPRIRRELKDEFLRAVFEVMKKTGAGEADGPKLLVFWKKPEVWAAQVYKWADDSGKVGGVETVIGLCSGDDTKREEFYGMPPAYMLAVLRILERSGKASIFEVRDSFAVKFLQ